VDCEWSPTASQFDADTHQIEFKCEAPAGELGLATTDQLVPFQRSTKVLSPFVLSVCVPTAKQLVVLRHFTAVRELSNPGNVGPGTVDQLVPFQRSIRVLREVATEYPTAKQLVVLAHARPPNVL
jgi:hypothetical protein